MSAIVAKLKEKDQDFEWYPTTHEVLECVKSDMRNHFCDYDGSLKAVSILDCGAGDGRCLDYLTQYGKKYAIEKSQVLLTHMDPDIFIVGTDFEQSTLIDKKVDMVFCNPPYSDYEAWASRVIAEANASMVYLVIPSRWKNRLSIAHAIKQRDAGVEVIGSFDFHKAERQARAQVDILAIRLYYRRRITYRSHLDPMIDPFSVWFDNQFVFEADKVKSSEGEPKIENDLKEEVKNAVVKGEGVISTLVKLYNRKMEILWKNYKAVSALDPSILNELGVDTKMLKGSLKQKITGLKNTYWKELFDNYHTITSRLTLSSREAMLSTLLENTAVDFTESNAYAVTVWAIKNANKYYDKQLIDLVEQMIDAANIKLYQSNKRTFGKEEWRYCRMPEGLSRFSLELRVVLSRKGGINLSTYSFEACNGLSNHAHDFLSDICTVANNLGYFCQDSSKDLEWWSGKKNMFSTHDSSLMEVKAFKNGNMHIKFNQNFLRKLNVEFGRLKGWLKNKQEASQELEIPLAELDMCFDVNFQLKSSDVPLLMAA